jgi:hypothetical protein
MTYPEPQPHPAPPNFPAPQAFPTPHGYSPNPTYLDPPTYPPIQAYPTMPPGPAKRPQRSIGVSAGLTFAVFLSMLTASTLMTWFAFDYYFGHGRIKSVDELGLLLLAMLVVSIAVPVVAAVILHALRVPRACLVVGATVLTSMFFVRGFAGVPTVAGASLNVVASLTTAVGLPVVAALWSALLHPGLRRSLQQASGGVAGDTAQLPAGNAGALSYPLHAYPLHAYPLHDDRADRPSVI